MYDLIHVDLWFWITGSVSKITDWRMANVSPKYVTSLFFSTW